MFKINGINFINFLIALLPASLILGNLITNINIVLICIVGLLIFKNKIFTEENKIYQYTVFAFFFYLISITLYSNVLNINIKYDELSYLYKEHLFKSIFFLRFFLLFLILNKLIEKNYFNIRLLFISCAFFSLLVSIDIIFQNIFKFNLIGIKISAYRPSSFFSTENIAGGYLQKFIFFFIFYLMIKIKNFKNNDFYFLILTIIFLVPILLTGNRMPTLIYIFSVIFYFILQKKIKQILVFIFSITLILFLLIKHSNIERFEIQLRSFANESVIIAKSIGKLFYSDLDEYEEILYHKKNQYNQNDKPVIKSEYLLHYNTAVQIWKTNKIFGNGLKSFRLNCEYSKYQTCNTHPHNYFFEILVDTGLIGLILIYFIFFWGLLNCYKKKIYDFDIKSKFVFFPFFSMTFFEFFPFRSSGSFFTTNNALIIFFGLAVFINVGNIKKIIAAYKI